MDVTLSESAGKALVRLETLLKKEVGVAIAYSGGMDSAFLTLIAHRILGERYLAFFAESELMAAEETAYAKNFAEQHGFRLKRFTLKVLDLPVFQNNPPDRCYHCKHHIFTQFLKYVPDGWVLIDGSNLDDDSDYRPGKKALKELNVLSPLVEAGFTKELIRECLRYLNVPDFIRLPQACLATRVACGSSITSDLLRRIENGEEMLHQAGFPGARLRSHGSLARIEIPKESLPEALNALLPRVSEFKNLGFQHVTLDLEGYKCGSMNENLS